MNKNRRIIVGGMAWSFLSFPVNKFLSFKKKKIFPVEFIWPLPQNMSAAEADALQDKYVNVDGLLDLNLRYMEKGLLLGVNIDYFPDHVVFRYDFLSANAYVRWGVEKEALDLIHSGEFKIVTHINTRDIG